MGCKPSKAAKSPKAGSSKADGASAGPGTPAALPTSTRVPEAGPQSVSPRPPPGATGTTSERPSSAAQRPASPPERHTKRPSASGEHVAAVGVDSGEVPGAPRTSAQGASPPEPDRASSRKVVAEETLTTQLSDGRDRQGPPAAAEGPRRRSEAGAGAGASGPTQAHVPRQSRDMSIPERGTAPAEPSSPSGARHETSFAFNWLTEIGMGAYASAFVRAGFEEKDVLSAIEDKDFDEIEKFAGVAVKPGRRKKILLHARRLAATLASPATPPGPPGPADPAFTPSPVPVYRASSVDSPLPDASARALEGDVEERESDMAFTRVVPRGGVPTKSANSHSKRPRSSHQAMELEILAAEVSSASVALPVSAPDADVAPLPMGAASPRNDDGPSAARRSYRRQGGRSGRVRGWASEINTGASPGVPGARPNAVFPMLAAADGAAHARAAVEAEAAGPPDDLSRDRSHSAGPANAEGRDGAARAAGGAPESGWWVGSPPRGTAAIPLRRNVPIDREPWARSRFRLFQAELEAHVAKVAASVRAGGADRPLTSISFVRLAREAKTTANLRRQAIEVELGLQRRVQDIKAGLRRRNAA